MGSRSNPSQQTPLENKQEQTGKQGKYERYQRKREPSRGKRQVGLHVGSCPEPAERQQRGDDGEGKAQTLPEEAVQIANGGRIVGELTVARQDLPPGQFERGMAEPRTSGANDPVVRDRADSEKNIFRQVLSSCHHDMVAEKGVPLQRRPSDRD